jgi:hypothetical protein
MGCSMRKDGRTDITKLVVAFHKSANAPKNVKNRMRMWSGLFWLSIKTWRVVANTAVAYPCGPNLTRWSIRDMQATLQSVVWLRP